MRGSGSQQHKSGEKAVNSLPGIDDISKYGLGISPLIPWVEWKTRTKPLAPAGKQQAPREVHLKLGLGLP